MTDEPLELARIIALGADAMEDTVLEREPHAAAVRLVERHQPSLRELAAARRENLEAHSGTTPDVIRAAGFGPVQVPPEVLQMRRAIDEVLAAAETLVAETADRP